MIGLAQNPRRAPRADARDRLARHAVEHEDVARVAQPARFALDDERFETFDEIPEQPLALLVGCVVAAVALERVLE